MFQVFCLHFIFFGNKVSLGWPQTFNFPASVSWMLRIQMCTTMASFFSWERLCREGLDNLYLLPFLQSSQLTAELQLQSTWQEHVLCWGPWPVSWAPQPMPSYSHSNESRQKPSLCDGVLVCFSSRPFKLRDDQISHSFLEVTWLPQNLTTPWYS